MRRGFGSVDIMYRTCKVINVCSIVQKYLRPGATKGTLRRENENSFFDVLCLITFHWSFKKNLAF